MSDDEITRVRRAYAQRRVNDDRYDPLRADVIAVFAARNQAWGHALRRRNRRVGDVLEVGAGTGGVLRWAVEVGAERAIGVDPLEGRLREGRALNPRIAFAVGDGRRLPLRSHVADTVICSMLFSSVLDDQISHVIAREIARVLRPDGCVLWFDFFRNNPSNGDVRGVRRSHLLALFPQWRIEIARVVLAPPIARRLTRRPRLAATLEMLPPLRTFYAGLLDREG